MTTTAHTPTEQQITAAAQRLRDASWGRLGGGVMVFAAADLSGGAWYSATSRPRHDQSCIAIPVPSRSITQQTALQIVREAIA